MVNVEVLCTNGHRVRVTTNPNTTLLQILEEACNRKSLGPLDEYSLKHNGKVLDLSLPFRYSGLTNNAKLEMVRIGASHDSTFTIALQLESGSRKLIECRPDTTLADVLTLASRDDPDVAAAVSADTHADQTPVIVYLREEIPGWFCLRNTSLKALGLTKGGAAFRFLWRRDIEEQTHKAEQALRERLASKAGQTSPMDTSAPAPSSPSPAPSNVAPIPQMEVGACHRLDSGGPSRGFSWFNDPPPPQPSTFQSQPVVSVFDSNPFERALESGPQPPVLSDFKFPDDTAGQNLYRNELSASKVEDFKACDRQSAWFKLHETSSTPAPIDPSAELPDSFFEVTESDLRLMLTDLRKQIREEAEAPLMTQSMRLAAKEAKYDKYERAVIRFVFPDAVVLQAIFRPRETVHALYKFIGNEIGHNRSFILYTSPPKIVLKDKTATLIEADLVPLSRIYVGNGDDSGEDSDLKRPDVPLVSQKEAEAIVLEYMKSIHADKPASSERPSSSAGARRTEAKDSKSSQQEGKSATVPKWFKTGK